jgi:hypothetical protein
MSGLPSKSARPQPTKCSVANPHGRAITPAEIARITWASLLSVKAAPVVLEVKPLFEISGGDRNQNSPTRS